MTATALSIVIPARDEADHLPETFEALAVALEKLDQPAELILVDDGSRDSTAAVARRLAEGRLPLRIVTQENRGRFEARRIGIEAATGEFVLLLDARVRLRPEALRFAMGRVCADEVVWNGHVLIESDDTLATFWRLLAELAWRDYFDDPRTTSFGLEEFDRFPKGTTCFLAARTDLLDAIGRFQSRYADIRLANDDTPILRDLARRHRFHLSPEFACVYVPRTSLAAFIRHAIHRGVVFLDGHLERGSRFRPLVLGFYPASAALGVAVSRRPLLAPTLVAVFSASAGAYGLYAGRTSREIRVLATVGPIYGLAHGLGMWKGIVELARARMRG